MCTLIVLNNAAPIEIITDTKSGNLPDEIAKNVGKTQRCLLAMMVSGHLDNLAFSGTQPLRRFALSRPAGDRIPGRSH
jgi:hypothetical protein